MPIDINQILQLAPLALAKPGSPQAAALMQGYQQSVERIQRQKMLEQQFASQDQYRQQSLASQDQFRQSQTQNMEVDNARQDEQLDLNRILGYLNQDQRQLGAMQQAPETALAPEATPLQAQNDLTVQRLQQQ